jgi:uncharacterized membrane protein YjjP (DUF1212 family)
MALNKRGSPAKIQVVKNAGFTLSENFLAEMILKQIPEKEISVDQLHNALKSIGIINYSSDDMAVLMDRLQAIGFSILK